MEAPESTDKAPAPQPTPLEWSQLPEWLQGTSPQELYELAHFEGGGDNLEEVCLSREEYIALKVRLAELRSIPLTPEQIESLECDHHHNDPETARHNAPVFGTARAA